MVKILFELSSKFLQRLNPYIFLAVFLSIFPAEAKFLSGDSITYKVETRASFAGGENTPFWLVSNIYGLGAPQFNNGFVRGKIEKPLSSEKRFSWGVTADLVGAWNLPSAFKVQQLFADIKYRRLWVSLGAREYKPLFNNLKLSSGDLLFSGNAMPIPQLRVGTYGFAPFWGTNGWLSVNAYIAYGMFTDSKWVRNWVAPGYNYATNVLYCSRALWFGVGKKEVFPLTFEFGCELGTQFGGTAFYNGETIKMPTRFIDWVKAAIPFAGGSNTIDTEQQNVQGNMNGEYSSSLVYSPTPDWSIKLYWNHYFEDHSQMFYQYGLWKDGLWGLELDVPKNPFLSKFVFEYVSTYDQTGAVMHDPSLEIPEHVAGQDNYFDHYLYGAWQNWGMAIGTPLAISPLYNRIHEIVILNSRFRAFHLALQGSPMKNLDWRFLLTLTKNWGTYFRPLPDIYNNCSGLLEVNYKMEKLRGFSIKGAIAWDKGKLLGNNFGGMFALSYEGDFSLKK